MGMKKDFIVRRSITMVDGYPHVESYSEQELVRCKDCKNGVALIAVDGRKLFDCDNTTGFHDGDWFCADGERRK